MSARAYLEHLDGYDCSIGGSRKCLECPNTYWSRVAPDKIAAPGRCEVCEWVWARLKAKEW